MQDDELLLPAGTRLVHIGPHKTGTTTVQFAFHAARPELKAQGVYYPGPNSQPMFAVYAVTGQFPSYVEKAPMRDWRRLVAGIDAAAAERAVISSEGFCDAGPAAVRRVVGDLGPDRVHIVVTLRPLTELLASQWQQSIQDGQTQAYDHWLDVIFNRPDSAAARSFWHRHRHDELVRRWLSAVGPEQLTVVVVDVRRPEALLRLFERLVGLRDGTLHAQHRTNRSLTRPEIELVRALNATLGATPLDPRLRVGFVRDGVAELLRARELAPGEPRITTPDWARERASAISRDIVAGITASGVRVIGPLERLAEPAPSAADVEPHSPTEPGVAAEIAATGPLGMMVMAGLARGTAAPTGSPAALSTVSTTQLRRVLVRRARKAVRERAGRGAAAIRGMRSASSRPEGRAGTGAGPRDR